MEHLPWKVICVDRISGDGRDVAYGEFNDEMSYCNQPEEYKARVLLVQHVPFFLLHVLQ